MLPMLSKNQVAFLNWLSLDREDRGMTDAAFADLIGVNPKTLIDWKKNPEFQQKLVIRRQAIEESPDYASFCIRQRTVNQMWVEFESISKKAKKTDKDHVQLRGYADKLLALTQHVERTTDTVDFSDLTDEDLLGLCMKWDVSPAAMTGEEIRRAYQKKKAEEKRWMPQSGPFSQGPLSEYAASVAASGSVGQPVTGSVSPKANPQSKSQTPARSRKSSTRVSRASDGASESRPLIDAGGEDGVGDSPCPSGVGEGEG